MDFIWEVDESAHPHRNGKLDDGQRSREEERKLKQMVTNTRDRETTTPLENVENDPDMLWGTGSASSKRQGEVTKAKAKEQHVDKVVMDSRKMDTVAMDSVKTGEIVMHQVMSVRTGAPLKSRTRTLCSSAR